MRLSKALDHFGTIKDFSEAIGVASSTVAGWKKRDGQIPENYVPATKAALENTTAKGDESLCFDIAMARFGTIERIAGFFDVHPKTVYFWKSTGRIPANSACKLNELDH